MVDDISGSHQLFVSSHLRERDKMLLRAILSGGVWTGFLLSMVKKEDVPCRFFGASDHDGHLFWDCIFLPSLSFVTNLSFFLSWVGIALTGPVVFFGKLGNTGKSSRTDLVRLGLLHQVTLLVLALRML